MFWEKFYWNNRDDYFLVKIEWEIILILIWGDKFVLGDIGVEMWELLLFREGAREVVIVRFAVAVVLEFVVVFGEVFFIVGGLVFDKYVLVFEYFFFS